MAAMKAEAKSVMMAGSLRAMSMPVTSGTISNHAEMLNVFCRLCSITRVSASEVVEPLRPAITKTTSAIINDGVVVKSMYLMWVNKGTSAVEDASTVVSLMSEILSPKYAPEMMAPAIQPSLKPNALPIPIKATPMVAMVVHEEPVSNEITAHIMHVAGRNIEG